MDEILLYKTLLSYLHFYYPSPNKNILMHDIWTAGQFYGTVIFWD